MAAHTAWIEPSQAGCLAAPGGGAVDSLWLRRAVGNGGRKEGASGESAGAFLARQANLSPIRPRCLYTPMQWWVTRLTVRSNSGGRRGPCPAAQDRHPQATSPAPRTGQSNIGHAFLL
jgi:hypothetical protein